MAAALAVMAIWGFNFAVAKIGLREFSPIFMMFLRFAAVAAVLLPFVQMPRGQMGQIFVLSVILGGIHFPLMFTGLTRVDAATASIAVQLQVPFSAILAAALYRDRLGWQRSVNYGKRSLGEVAMFRYKKVIGRSLHARSLPAQKTEAKVACKVLNIMTGFGMPASRRVA